MMYEDDDKKCKRKTMGIALKRRDNAPIVKDIFGTALDLLMEKRDIKLAFNHVKGMLVDVIQNKFPMEKFVITKQLRDDYKNPEQIAHRVLADRMEERDAGNKPQVGDRLSFVFVAGRTGKQGDRIDHVDYVKAKGLKVDTEFYITNQIQNPLAQLFALAIENTQFNPFILPLNWNFRPIWHRSFFGPIKVWHDYSDPPPYFEELNTYYSNKDSIIQYHQG